ncbi:MAG: TetR/AcrR family transcriptional regulator [Sporomusaceae bacterium]|nr:TetR/AcrR family transcriptional regulator [Sporomusaceae bacterium]
MSDTTRVRKDPEVRQIELIDAATELFCSNGYEKTMVADIVKQVGVAKGTFFYYFPTKEAILEAICTRWASELVASVQLQSRQFTALHKLQFFISQLTAPTQIDIMIDKLWSEKQFNLVYTTWQKQVENIFNPLLADIIEQGNQEGSMQVNSIKETTAFFWSTLDCLWESAYLEEAEDVLLAKEKIAESVLEHLLGIESGRIKLSAF